MIALISPAKTMREKVENNSTITSEPRFMEQTRHIISMMLRYNSSELEQIFKISPAIARDLKHRFSELFDTNRDRSTAIDSYDGVVYKHFKSDTTISSTNAEYLQSRVRISSLLYGLLRPYDMIKPYRMEGFVRLADSDERVDRYWRDIQTQTLIDDTKEMGGTLLYLASKEEQNAFNWREVKKEVRVIDIQFLQYKGDKLRQVVVYTKMARGEMIRFMTNNNITNPEEVKKFEWSGYKYNPDHSSQDVWVWIME